MADDNRPLKYIRYAIGEIALVVIGILIALQINNWNEKRKAQTLEEEYLIGLKNEFKTSLIELDYYINVNQSSMDAISEIFKLMGPNTKPDTINYDRALELGLKSIGYSLQYDVSSGVLEDLISSGNLNTLTNKKLKETILSWKQLLRQTQRNQERSLHTQAFIFEEFNDLFDGRNTIPLYFEEPSGKSKFENTGNNLMTNKSYENALAYYKASAILIQNYGYLPLKELNLKIIDIINQELKYND